MPEGPISGAVSAVKRALGAGGGKIDPDVQKMLKRGRERLAQVTPRRREAIEFARNNHFVAVDKTGLKLVEQSTVPRWAGGEKPDHRVRRSHDLISPILKGKISGATSKVPGYEVVPSTSDPEDYAATRLSKKILTAAYEGPWRVKQAFRRFVWNALVTEEAFIMPYWDSSIGPYIQVGEDGEYVAMGEIRACVYNGLEVIWEPGVEFEDTRWFAIEHARPKRDIEKEAGFLGGPLKADADTNPLISTREKPKGGDLVIVTEFFERPCPDYPKGRRCFYANGHEIFEAEDYPLEDAKGNIVDEVCLHRAVYQIDGASDRHRGLVASMIESMRAYDYGANKAAEYLQLVLIPQMIAPEGAIKGELDDEPGAVIEVDEEALANGEIKWREMPSMPQEFMEVQDRAKAELGDVSLQSEVPAGVESAKAFEAIKNQDEVAWQDFMEDVARCHAAFGRDALCIAQRRYTEERLFQFRGRTGWETIQDFKGADIRHQTDVRVNSGSFESKSRQQVESQIMAIAGPAGMFPNHFPPEVILRALSSADLDLLNEAFEEDEARVNFIIAQIRAGTFWNLPSRPVFPEENVPRINPRTGEPLWIQPPEPAEEPEFDPATGEEIPGTGSPGSPGIAVMETRLPGWMPRPFDNVPVHKLRVETFMKSDEWNYLDDAEQEATIAYYKALIDMETKAAARAQELQTERAEDLGMRNAAAPQSAKPLPTQPGGSPPPGANNEAGGGQQEPSS